MKYLLLALLSLVSAQSVIAANLPPQFAESGVVFLKQHCIDCHGGDDPEAGLLLTAFTTNASLIPMRTKWDGVLRMVETGVMPPADAEQPSQEQRVDFVKLVRSIFSEY
jgi:mono/diheme cytochrome c family protein